MLHNFTDPLDVLHFKLDTSTGGRHQQRHRPGANGQFFAQTWLPADGWELFDGVGREGVKILLIMLACTGLIAPVYSASFDCAKANTTVEKLICGDAELSRMDDVMSMAYRKVFELSDAKSWMVYEQRMWITKARNICKNPACLKNAYLMRITELSNTRPQVEPLPQDQKMRLLQKKRSRDESKKFPPRQKTTLCTPAARCEQIALLYSEDDSICKPLLSVYQQLMDKNKRDQEYRSRSGSQPSFKGYWEDYYAEIFAEAGFIPPPPLQDEQHKYIPTESSLSGELALVFYKLSLDQGVAEQTVLVRDYWFASHGDYSSDVYVSKPGEDISTTCSQDFFVDRAAMPGTHKEGCGNRAVANQLAFATDFRFEFRDEDHISAETLISRVHFFEKEHTDEKFSIVLHGETVPLGLRIGNSTIQRLYLYRNQTIFTARAGTKAVVYRIKHGSQIDEVCYFASSVARVSH